MFEEFMQVNPSNLKIEVNSEEWQNNGWFHLQDNKENEAGDNQLAQNIKNEICCRYELTKITFEHSGLISGRSWVWVGGDVLVKSPNEK